jgi:hypothetical protein
LFRCSSGVVPDFVPVFCCSGLTSLYSVHAL